MFDKLEDINTRPAPFEFYTAAYLWTDSHTSKKMLEYHLDESVDLSSRNKDFIDRSVNWMVSRFGIGVNTRIADFGCGPGLYTSRLAAHHADVTGIDFSRRSIEHARKFADRQGLNIAYRREDYLRFDTGKRFDLITMIFCDFCALSPIQRKTLLTKFYTFLKPGGAVLLDVHSLNTFNQIEEAATYERNQLDGFWSSDEYYGFQNIFKNDAEKVSLYKYTIVEKTRVRTVYNWLQFFNQESLSEEVEKCGFKAKAFYSDIAGTPFSADSPDLAIVAKKR
jgi:SAM-dependent methyltransferase